MRIEQLKYFYAAAKYNSITAAAEKMHITPQGMSMAIKSLEKELGEELLEKKPSGVSLTAQGAKIHPYVMDILNAVDKIEACCKKTASAEYEPKGKLSIYTTPFLGEYYIGTLLVEFGIKHSKVETLMQEDHVDNIIKKIRENNDAIGVINCSKTQMDALQKDLAPLLQVKVVYSSKVKAAMAAHHPLAKLHEVTFKQLSKYPVVAATEMTLENYGVTDLLQQYGKIKYANLYNNMRLQALSLLHSQSVSYMFGNIFRMVDEDKRKQLAVVNIKNAPEHTVAIITAKTFENKSPQKIFIDEAVKFIETLT